MIKNIADMLLMFPNMSQGKTIDKALANVKDAIEGWLLVEKKHNRLEFNEIKELFVGEVAL
jgi:predicted RNase H-like HicB family nuclease